MKLINDKNYVAAELNDNLVSEVKLFEEMLRDQTNKNVVLIAYETDENQ